MNKLELLQLVTELYSTGMMNAMSAQTAGHMIMDAPDNSEYLETLSALIINSCETE